MNGVSKYESKRYDNFAIICILTASLSRNGAPVEYASLDKRSKNYLNGKIAQFMDAYIRQHKVWTPDQMLDALVEMMQGNITGAHFNSEFVGGVEVWNSEISDRWLLSDHGQELALERMQKKYEKDKPVAKANSPIVQRVRFGLGWDDSKFFDISFGLKGGFNFVETEELKKYPYKPWVVSHVEQQLNNLYDMSLADVLALLSTSPIEKAFYEYWLNKYYTDNSPALIPEVCGFRAKFWYLEYKDCVYASHQDLPPVDDPRNVKSKNFRFDFFVSNTKKNKAILIELDGHEHHKTKPQRIIDSIKRNEAAALGIPVVVFTGTQIYADIAACFASIDEILK